MWICPNCGTSNGEGLEDCLKCSYARPSSISQPSVVVEPEIRSPQVRFEMFRGRLATWDSLFSDAAAFATLIGHERVISISHSADQGDGVVTVWYWE